MEKNLNILDQYLKEGQPVANFSAQIQDDGNYYISRNILNNDLYQTDKQAVRDAFNTFEDQMIELAGKVKENGLCNY